ncbi:MAG: cyclic nucleotide-binding domain-containing protein [Aquificaceae bacterium]|nr:cyclic nucleotide-binding domain-containing protein [Aquificaceae bacterium]
MEIKEEMIAKIRGMGEEVKFNMGDIILHEGEKGDKVFVILSGHASVFKKGPGEDEVFVGLAGPGSVLGEMAIFLEGERTATVRASSVVRALVFDVDQFLSAVSKVPELAYGVLKELSKRVNSLNRRIVNVITSKLMYVIGMYLLENQKEETSYYPSEERIAELPIKKFCAEYGVEVSKIEAVLTTFQKAGVLSLEKSPISTDDGKEDTLYIVKFDHNKLKSYLRSIAYV